jgi:hypothetical protein
MSSFAIFHLRAHRLRADLELTALEMFDTRASMYSNLMMLAVGLFSVLLALLKVVGTIGLPGLIYLLTIPAQTVIDSWAGVRRRAPPQYTPATGARKDASAPDR